MELETSWGEVIPLIVGVLFLFAKRWLLKEGERRARRERNIEESFDRALTNDDTILISRMLAYRFRAARK